MTPINNPLQPKLEGVVVVLLTISGIMRRRTILTGCDVMPKYAFSRHAEIDDIDFLDKEFVTSIAKPMAKDLARDIPDVRETLNIGVTLESSLCISWRKASDILEAQSPSEEVVHIQWSNSEVQRQEGENRDALVYKDRWNWAQLIVQIAIGLLTILGAALVAWWNPLGG